MEERAQIDIKEDQLRFSQLKIDSILQISMGHPSLVGQKKFNALSETQQLKTDMKLENLSLFFSKVDNMTE